jgi:hypothetical protein
VPKSIVGECAWRSRLPVQTADQAANVSNGWACRNYRK